MLQMNVSAATSRTQIPLDSSSAIFINVLLTDSYSVKGKRRMSNRIRTVLMHCCRKPGEIQCRLRFYMCCINPTFFGVLSF